MYKGKNTHVIIPFSLDKPNDTFMSMNIVTTCYKKVKVCTCYCVQTVIENHFSGQQRGIFVKCLHCLSVMLSRVVEVARKPIKWLVIVCTVHINISKEYNTLRIFA